MEEPAIRPGDGEGLLLVSGDLVFVTVPALLEKASRLLAGRREVAIDLAEVTHADSAGLALLLEWIDRGRSDGCLIRFRNIPSSLLRIARLSNVEALLPHELPSATNA